MLGNIGLNVGFASPAYASSQQDAADWSAAMGFVDVRVDGSFQDARGTYSGSPDYTGVDAWCEAFAPLGGLGVVVYYPNKTDTLSWSTAEGGSLCSRYWKGAFSTAIDTQIDRDNSIRDRFSSRWSLHGGDASNLVFQVGNEIGIGGAGGPLSTASNNGKYDIYSDLAGTVSSPGYLRTQLASAFGEGTVPTDANFDTLATSLSRADIADLRGYHETMDYIMTQMDWGGHTLIAPAFEHQISAWKSSSAPLGLIGSNTIASRERSTYFNGSFSYYTNFSRNAFNIYVGDYSSYGSTTPDEYAENLHQMIVSAYNRLWSDSPSVHKKKKIWVTEIGFSANWLPSSTHAKRGEYWPAILSRLRRSNVIERAFLYRLKNYSAGEDAFNVNSNFGIFSSEGHVSEGADSICRGMGVSVPGTWPGGASVLTGTETTPD